MREDSGFGDEKLIYTTVLELERCCALHAKLDGRPCRGLAGRGGFRFPSGHVDGRGDPAFLLYRLVEVSAGGEMEAQAGRQPRPGRWWGWGDGVTYGGKLVGETESSKAFFFFLSTRRTERSLASVDAAFP